MMNRNKQRKPHRKGHGGSLSYLKIIINGVKKNDKRNIKNSI